MRSDINQAVRQALEQMVAKGEEIGVQVAAFLGDELIVDCWAGLADAQTGRPVDGDTLFNVFSVSKAVTATAAHLQAERGLIEYDAPVATYWPEFAAAGKDTVTVRQVLSHVSGVLRMPPEVTAEQLADWDWVCRRIAEMPPAYPPGSRSSYQSMTFGWMLGEVVRRTDPAHRPFGRFVREEIAEPLGAADLWLGIPDAAEPRVARLDARAMPEMPAESALRETIPAAVDLGPTAFEQPQVRRAAVPAVGGLFTARSEARFWAMLANGGAFNGVRLLSEERVRSFASPRPHFDDPEPVFGGYAMPMGWAGYWLGAAYGPGAAAKDAHALCHPGAGGSMGWADPQMKLAVAFCHNRMSIPSPDKPESVAVVGDLIRSLL